MAELDAGTGCVARRPQRTAPLATGAATATALNPYQIQGARAPLALLAASPMELLRAAIQGLTRRTAAGAPRSHREKTAWPRERPASLETAVWWHAQLTAAARL